MSKPTHAPAGTVAGCVLGQLMFIIFINDLFLSYSNKNCVAYDVSIKTRGNNIEKAEEQLQELFDIANLRSTTNHLYINPAKCACMLINSRIKADHNS